MNFLLTTLALAVLLISTFADKLHDASNKEVTRRELQTAEIVRTYSMIVVALAPTNVDLLSTCVTEQMLSILEEWAQSSFPGTILYMNSTVTVGTTTTTTGVRNLATVPVPKVVTSLKASGCSFCGSARKIRRRKLQTAASISMIKVLLPQICPELQNITTVNMTITSG
jgi:hypothetical protein